MYIASWLPFYTMEEETGRKPRFLGGVTQWRSVLYTSIGEPGQETRYGHTENTLHFNVALQKTKKKQITSIITFFSTDERDQLSIRTDLFTVDCSIILATDKA
uniref:Uncharacterized protein n=1 Tax=Spongospora subterranea TaxID=70186 RepID=A0A0H5R9L9_9EUKA|eukprot:CRZ10778.1 hypothetical protein [Spongospora subterranea]